MPKTTIKTYQWQAKNAEGSVHTGQIQAVNSIEAQAILYHQGLTPLQLKKQNESSTSRSLFKIGSRSIKSKEITVFIRQLATMLQTGIALFHAIELLRKQYTQRNFQNLLAQIQNDIESGNPLSAALRAHPRYFSMQDCAIIHAAENAGCLDKFLAQLAQHKEKALALKRKIRSALAYPVAISVAACATLSMFLFWVIPAFEKIFANFNAQLPPLTLSIIECSHFFIEKSHYLLGGIIILGGGFRILWKRSDKVKLWLDHCWLKLPFLNTFIQKNTTARWSRTLAHLFSASVPLTTALHSTVQICSNRVYQNSLYSIQQQLNMGFSLSQAMRNTQRFPETAIHLIQAGEESGTLDTMLLKIAEFFEAEIDEITQTIAKLIEPIIVTLLSIVIAILLIALYLPIFQLGQII